MLWPRPSAPESTPWGTPSPGADPLYIPIDSNGNLTQKTEGTDVWGYEWNARNQLTRVTKNAVEQARFAYDPLGRRVEKVAGGVTAGYTYDGVDILREVRGSSTFKYVHGPGIDEPAAREDGAAALTYFHADGLGSIVKHTNQAGAAVHEYRHDVWGNLEIGASEAGHAFTGREWDPETGLYYYRARYYDPRGGRFSSEDPIGFRGGINFYAYSLNSPSNATDPFGLFAGPYETGCALAMGAYAWSLGRDHGWRYAHCMASCLIARYCGQATSTAWGMTKEYVWDRFWCGLGRAGNCNSTQQPSDFDDNYTGATCPIQMTCEKACGHLKNVQEAPPGPYGGQGWW